jgi:hypothetical protein
LSDTRPDERECDPPPAIVFNLTERELQRSARLSARRWQRMFGGPGWLAFLLSAPVAFAGAGVAVISGATSTRGGGLVLVLMVGAYLSGVWLAYAASLVSQRKYLAAVYRSGSFGEDRRVEIDDDGIRLISDRSNSAWTWKEFSGVGVTEGLLLIWQRSSYGALTIPERCLESPAMREKIVAFIRARLTGDEPARTGGGG